MEFIPGTVFLLFVVIPLLVVLKELENQWLNEKLGWIINLLILGTIFPNLSAILLTASLITSYYLRKTSVVKMLFLLLSFIISIQLKNWGIVSGLEEVGLSLILINQLLYQAEKDKEEISLPNYLTSSIIGSVCFFSPKNLEFTCSKNDYSLFFHRLFIVVLIEGVFLSFFKGWIENGINSGFSLNFGQSWYLTLISFLSFALFLIKWSAIGNIFSYISASSDREFSLNKLKKSPLKTKITALVFLSLIFTFIVGIPYLQSIIFFLISLAMLLLIKKRLLLYYTIVLLFLIPVLHTQSIDELKYLIAGLLSLHTFFYYWNEELILSGFGGELWLCLTLFVMALYFILTKFKILYILPSLLAIILIGLIGIFWMI